MITPSKARASLSAGDPLNSLAVVQKLEVGPVHVEPRRVKAPYRLTQEGRTHTMELVFRFEEDVFQPEAADSLNLASMLAVQPALNYGLFCDELHFHGAFDRHDRQFIRRMAQNTAREIFVKKFLEPNPYLLGTFTPLPPVRQDSYLRADISFHEGATPAAAVPPKKGGGDAPWQADPSRYAVLSSGGKDSLLSFGLLRETGNEVHPVFINESGRHWFTALNAYRHFSAHVASTSRVWTNTDRVFNWVLRHLPFVRPDFAGIRSDAYPIRLWTVAPFLFGALPILRRRGIGRLVVGDEFDTTQKASFRGIPHFNGLYDQSSYFDRTLTRYFHSKRWGISQFSILRSLSELLIEKILVERYPDLQHQQVSCHAAHMDKERVYPCGRCEKCRRIVGLLSAISADPVRCGYNRAQIDRCLKEIVHKGIHQEKVGVEHLAHLLKQGGWITRPQLGPVAGRERPQVMQLRFDPQKSPVEGIPVDLRRPLYGLYLKHATGAVKRSGRTWIDFDLLNHAALKRPYIFDSPPTETGKAREKDSPSPTRGNTYLLGELTWPEARHRFMEVDISLLPVGAVEQHGPHLPLDADAFDADYLARQVARACSEPRPLVLPLVPYGVSYHHEDFVGTISISPDTLSKLVYDIGMSAARHGITKLVIINGHGGNSPALHFAAQMINRDAHIFTCVDTGETSDPDVNALATTANDVHAGEIETSTTLATRPHLVKQKEARKFIPRFSSRYLDFSSRRSVGWYAHTSKISPTGVLGDPTKADAEKGQRMWDYMIKHLVEFVEDLKTISLDEIYQKRY